jgi:hypothetical protein
MTWGYKTGGRDFVKGFDPRRQYHRGPTSDRTKLRSELINHYALNLPDALLDVLESRGLIPGLVERYRTRKRRDPSLGGPRWIMRRRGGVR